MDPLLALGWGYAILMGVGLAVAGTVEDWSTAAWDEALRACGFAPWRSAPGWRPRRRVQRGWLQLDLKMTRSRHTTITADGLTRRMGLRADALLGRLARPGWGADAIVGDEAFDRFMVVDAEQLVALAFLGAVERADLLVLAGSTSTNADGMTLASGRLRMRVRHDRDFTHNLQRIVRLCESLREPKPGALEERLVTRVAGDPAPRVRLAALTVLMEERPRHPATPRALRVALTDVDEEVRLIAALALRSEGREVLQALARDPHVRDGCSARALAALPGQLEVGGLEVILAQALRAGRERTIVACLEALASQEVVAPIRRILAGEHPARAAAAAAALGLARGPEAERELQAALLHAVRPVRRAAARSLGRMGSAASVPALRDAQRTAAGANEADLARDARQAVAAIQARLQGVEHGRLALAPAAGEVSLTDDAGGRLALPRDRAATMGPAEPD
jgi:HEAT repeat protein